MHKLVSLEKLGLEMKNNCILSLFLGVRVLRKKSDGQFEGGERRFVISKVTYITQNHAHTGNLVKQTHP